MKNRNSFEPQVFSNMDDSLLQCIGEDLSLRNMNERVVDRVTDATDEEFSNFRFLGIGKPTEKQKKKAEERKEKREAAKKERQEKGFLKRAGNIAKKFNPAAALVRAGTLAGIRLNIFGIARKLYPALLSESELKARNFDLENAKKAKEALAKAHKFYFGLGGRNVSFDNAVRKGWDKPIFRTKKMKALKAQEKSSFTSYNPNDLNTQIWGVFPVAERPYFYGRSQGKGNGIEFEPVSNFNKKYLDLPNNEELNLPFDDEYYDVTGVEEATITAALGTLSNISLLISKLVKDNPYKQGSSEYSQAQSDIDAANAEGENTPPAVSQEEINKLMEQAKQDVAKGGDPMEDEGEKDKILGMSKTTFWIVTGLVAVTAIGLVIWKMKKK